VSYSQLFFDDTLPLLKPRFVCVESDWNFLCEVFPEPGFRSYFLGHIVSKLANELKEHGINSFHDREKRLELATITGLLSNIVLVRKESLANDGPGVGGACEEDAYSQGESADSTGVTKRETEKREKDSTEGGLKFARLDTL